MAQSTPPCEASGEPPLGVPVVSFDTVAPSSTPDTFLDTPPCPFCAIAASYPPYDPRRPPPGPSKLLDPSATSPNPATFLLLSTPILISFLDIAPLSPGHLLLCPRTHRPKLTDLTPTEASSLGYWLRILSMALVRATGVADWNVVQNNGAAAAQVVPHMHYHVIPRPELGGRGRERFTSTMFGRGAREELDELEAERLAEAIRGAVAEVQAEEEEREQNKKPKL